MLSKLCSFGILAASLGFGAANVQSVVLDGPGEGFNDNTPAAPVGGNIGVTVGQQRLLAFQHAAGIWAATLTSAQTIRVAAFFNPLPCTPTSGVLGGAAPFTSYIDSVGGSGLPAGVWYPAGLAEKLTNLDLGAILLPPGNNFEVFTIFNSSLGTPTCLPGGWYYGLDNNPPAGQINLVSVVLHELGHGMGFTVNPTNAQTGVRSIAGGVPYPSVWEQFMRDITTGKRWLDMTNAERASSSINTNNLVWTGGQTQVDAPQVLSFRPELEVQGPPSVSGLYEVSSATFGPPLTATGTKDILTTAIDTGGVSPFDGCEPYSNRGNESVKGRIALVDRGTCNFTVKVKNAQLAGAIGVVVANNTASGLPGMTGSDPTITIPSIGISQQLGQRLRAQPQMSSNGRGGVPVTIQLSTTIRAGTTGGFVRLYAPNLYEPGSSVSHWDTSLTPNVLMEPFATPGLSQQLTPPKDLTFSLLRDLGW